MSDAIPTADENVQSAPPDAPTLCLTYEAKIAKLEANARLIQTGCSLEDMMRIVDESTSLHEACEQELIAAERSMQETLNRLREE